MRQLGGGLRKSTPYASLGANCWLARGPWAIIE